MKVQKWCWIKKGWIRIEIYKTNCLNRFRRNLFNYDDNFNFALYMLVYQFQNNWWYYYVTWYIIGAFEISCKLLGVCTSLTWTERDASGENN